MLEINFIICRFQLRSDKQNMMNRKMIPPTVRYFVAIQFCYLSVQLSLHVDHIGCKDIKMQQEQSLHRMYSHFQPWVHVYYNFHFQLQVSFLIHQVCGECDREDRMLLCDGCDNG